MEFMEEYTTQVIIEKITDPELKAAEAKKTILSSDAYAISFYLFQLLRAVYERKL